MGKQHKEKEDANLAQLRQGIEIVQRNAVFQLLVIYNVKIVGKNELGKKTPACSRADGMVLVNRNVSLSPKNWAYAIAHCILHNCFGHYDLEKVPGFVEEDLSGNKVKKPRFNKKLWNIACDIYVDKFLQDIKLGDPLNALTIGNIPLGILEDENKIYEYLLREHWDENDHIYGVGAIDSMDMDGLDTPIEYGIDRWGDRKQNEFAVKFAGSLARSVSGAIDSVAHHEREDSFGRQIAGWFINSFPLLGAIAASFKIVDDVEECRKYDISLAAVDAYEGIIYINTSKNLSDNEWRFVMAHEFLHAALMHHNRLAGRDPYLWNIATDYVINGWLYEMQIGVMPEGVLYDPALKNKSAEEIYDEIICDIKRFRRLDTFRGNGRGDIMGRRPGGFGNAGRGVSLDEFYRNALSQGLEYEIARRGRGYIPAGLVEEIRALAVPPVPWDVKLAEWFNAHIRPLEKHRSYAHPSRRQSCTPDIPRARFVPAETSDAARTFGVIIDTSGSMEPSEIGKALGAVASYAASRDVIAARVIFCDANAYDAGYMTPDDIAGRVKVIGRGGTRLQPAVDLLQTAKDFPKDGPVLIITDGWIEDHLDVKREHAYVLPVGGRLPFRPRGEVFYLS